MLADAKAELWIKLLANKVKHLNSRLSASTEEDICAILCLPCQIQRAIFAHMVSSQDAEVQLLMDQLPVLLHSALINS